MIPASERTRLLDEVPLGSILGETNLDEFMELASLARIPAGRDIMAEGEKVAAVPLLVSGRIRVYRVGETGREITIYRFSGGECCVLSADSILGSKSFPANAQTEEDTEVVFIPAHLFDRWLIRSPAWRAFVFESMSRRLVSLLDTVDDVAFRRMDVRVADLLINRSAGRGVVSITHQAMADELGSSREVISRVLEDLQSRGHVRLTRGAVEVVSPDSLREIAGL